MDCPMCPDERKSSEVLHESGVQSVIYTEAEELSMTHRMIATILACLACSAASGQGGDQLPSFEVASVKPAPTTPGGRHLCFPQDPILYRCTGVTVSAMAFQAYGLKMYQFPTYSAYTTEYNVEAKAPEGATADQVKLMLRNLLAERFKLAAHFEKKEMAIYELKVAQSGLKIRESSPEAARAAPAPPVPESKMDKDADGFPIYAARPGEARLLRANGLIRMVARAASLDSLVNYLGNQLDLPVIDSTGLKAKCDYTLTFASASVKEGRASAASTSPDEVAPPSGGGPTIFAALERQLGLNLAKTKGMIDIFVIDHVEKTPTPD